MRPDTSLLGMTFVALLAAAAEADTLRVPQDFATIQEAVDAAVAGDIVLVSKGPWAPFAVIGKADVTIQGKGKPVVDGAGDLAPVVGIDASPGVTLVGLVIRNAGDRGIDVTGSTAVTISKCRLEDIEGVGINLAGSGHLVEKTRISGTNSEAINIEDGAADIVLDKNRLTDTDGAITFRGDGHVATKNRVKDSRDEGFSIIATNCLIEKNRFNGVDDDALDVEGDDNTFVSNRIRNVGSNGVEVSPAGGDPFVVTGNLFEKNRVSKADGSGFLVETAGNTFRKNKAKQSGEFDVWDTAGRGANVYEDNVFPNAQFE